MAGEFEDLPIQTTERGGKAVTSLLFYSSLTWVRWKKGKRKGVRIFLSSRIPYGYGGGR